MVDRRGLNLYHEAGHATLLLSLGRHFAKMTPRCVEFASRDRYPDLAMIHLSGVASELLAGGVASEGWEHAKVDAENAKRCAAEYLKSQGGPAGRTEIEAQLESDWRATIKLLKRHWKVVERPVMWLGRGDVSYEQAKAIFDRPDVVSAAFCGMRDKSDRNAAQEAAQELHRAR
jgi:hypothetical protein